MCKNFNKIDIFINNQIYCLKQDKKLLKNKLIDLDLAQRDIEENEYKRLHKKAKYAYRAMIEYEDKLRKLNEVTKNEN